jgi:intergrase/recombinase
MNDKTVGDRMRYAKQFYSILQTGDASSLMQIKPDKRIHAMKALASLARFTGSYDTWLAIRQRYNLKWSTGNESLATFERFFLDDNKTLDSMLQWVKEAIKVLPASMGQIIKFNVLTGLRPNEAIQSIRLLNRPDSQAISYYNLERQCLEHFRFPELFIRRTKAAYVSIIEREQLLGLVQNIRKIPTYEVLRFRCTRAGLSFHMGYCRKIYSSWLRQSGIPAEIVDLLSGRVPRSIFARHYFTPSEDYRVKVLQALEKLQRQLLLD